MIRARPALASILLLGLAACAAAPSGGGMTPASASAAPAIAGTRWIGVVDASIPEAARPRLEFNDQGRISGFTGCNMLSGTWRLEGNEVRFGPVTTTKRGCMGVEGDIEKRFLAALSSGTSARRDGQRLRLTAPGGTFELSAAP